MKKCFILTQFGKPHEWTQEYFDNVAKLEATGWYWKIFTPNKYENLPSNVEIISMTIEEFDTLIEKKIGVFIGNSIKNGVPSKHVSDLYVASGAIFEDYIKDFDFWGITNWDIVYGRLSHFVPDQLLEQCDIFADDVNTINGIFTLFRNRLDINNLFKEIPDWETKFKTHQLYGLDEYDMTQVARKNSSWMRFLTLAYYPMHSHDRLETQNPVPKLSMKEDGSLWELSEDIGHPNWEHARPFIGREIPLYHFIKTKKWPKM